MKTLDMSTERNEMVEHQIKARGVRDGLVLDAMQSVPREEFIPEKLREFAYADTPLPIAADQTISQPYIVAFMIEALALEGGERVLEIGAGSGYAAAVLGKIAAEVYTIERIEELAEHAESTLKAMNCLNVHVLCGDGTLGWPAHAPFDAIIVAAGGPSIPESLQSQLKGWWRLVIPVCTNRNKKQKLRVTRLS
jgi:protein-L-isoaspartate(D-aspartate) O-methyltransferase